MTMFGEKSENKGPRPIPRWTAALLMCVCLGLTNSCANRGQSQVRSGVVLTMMPAGENAKDIDFFRKVLADYERRTGVQVRLLAAYDSVDTRIRLLEDIFRQQLKEPDICGIDNIWPGVLAQDLLDLRPYLRNGETAFSAPLLGTFTVNGRLIGMPETFEIPALYYRKDLLKKYGYLHPPETWDHLERMAKTIQDGERKAGHPDFWGYIWQGAEGEALTCNAMEWQRGEGVSLIEKSGKVCADNAAAEYAIRRARSWIGKISPPSVVEYEEEDASNFWLAGSAAFARGWPSLYALSNESSSLSGKFGTALLPGGRKGRASTFGGMGLSVSRYSLHPKEAVEVVRYLLSAEVERDRLIATGSIPSRMSLMEDSVLLKNSVFGGWPKGQPEEGIFSRPSGLTGNKYDAVSRSYAKAVHEAISGKLDAHAALSGLQTELESMLGNESRAK